jgi:ubiquinone/menaquinone biosynthesis C-methylase UbiE
MTIQAAYNDWSTSYDFDQNLTRDLDRYVTQKTLAHGRYQSILEIGCGTGKHTPLLARIGRKVTALDFSEGMLQKAREKVAADHVTFLVADVSKRWPCADLSADLVTCNLVLEHIEDLSFIFAEAWRTLVADGRLFICELHPFRQYRGSKATYQSDQGATEIQAFVHHVSDFLGAARQNDLALSQLREWWDENGREQPPRLLSLLFEKR